MTLEARGLSPAVEVLSTLQLILRRTKMQRINIKSLMLGIGIGIILVSIIGLIFFAGLEYGRETTLPSNNSKTIQKVNNSENNCSDGNKIFKN